MDPSRELISFFFFQVSNYNGEQVFEHHRRINKEWRDTKT